MVGLLVVAGGNGQPWQPVRHDKPLPTEGVDVRRTSRSSGLASLFPVPSRTHGSVVYDKVVGITAAGAAEDYHLTSLTAFAVTCSSN